jgi:hypothetical protein
MEEQKSTLVANEIEETKSQMISIDVGGVFFTIDHALLTKFEDSAIAAMFSGRWDESNNMKDGRVIIEGKDPNIFKYIIEYLSNGNKTPKIEDKSIMEKVREEFVFWNIPFQYKWEKGSEEPRTVWFSNVELEKLEDPLVSESLSFNATLNFTQEFSGCILQVWVLVLSRNNPDRLMHWAEVTHTCLGGQKGRKEKVSIKIPMIGDEDFR